jgi:hypothetical protein
MKLFMSLQILFLTVVSCGHLPACAFTLSFDDVGVGQDVSYYQSTYGVAMTPGWRVINSQSCGWDTPQSGEQAVVWAGDASYAAGLDFGFADGASEYKAQRVGAYFTTAPGVIIRMSGYGSRVVTATIGDSVGAWVNRYVEIASPTGFAYVHFTSVSPSDARYHFTMDDLTIVPVPEPASVVGLAAA